MQNTPADVDQTAVIPAQRGATPATPEPPAAESSPYRGPIIAMLLYAGLRVIGVLVLWAYAEERGLGLKILLTKSDALWYENVATTGYDEAIRLNLDNLPLPTDLAFFPLYPMLIAIVRHAPLVDAAEAGLLVSWTAGLAVAWGLYAIGRHLRDARTGIVLAALWAVLPHGIVASMGYSETLFTALAAWSLWALLRRQWVLAGALCLLAGLTRPTGGALVVAVGLAALLAVIRDPRDWRPWLAGVLAPLGLVGYIAWVGARLGRWDGYFHVQDEAWKMGFDGGRYTFDTLGEIVTKPVLLALYVTTAVLFTALALLAIGIGARLPWPLLVFAAVVLVLALGGDGYYWAKARLIMPAFPLLIPVAYAIAGSRNRVVPYAVLGLLTTFSALYGVYLLTIWKYSP